MRLFWRQALSLWFFASALIAIIAVLYSKQQSNHIPTMSAFDEQMEKITKADGFVAALDQSGGSTPKALNAYGYPENLYVKGEESMFAAVHAMRSRIMTSPSFNGDRILAAILFEDTMDRNVNDLPTGQYLWQVKNIVPILKVDKGLEAEENGVQLMKPIPGLDHLLKRAKQAGIFGTKMRSVINLANDKGVKAIVDQQFEIGKQIVAAGLVPILEPEVNIRSPEKAQAETLLKQNLLQQLNNLGEDEKVMLKLSLPSVDNFYKECIEHINVVRVVALSGGYTREEANEILARQNGMTASFSRALVEGLTYPMSEEEFDTSLNKSIQSIFDASKN
jgi:fructose-bisphosphate aldolase class I